MLSIAKAIKLSLKPRQGSFQVFTKGEVNGRGHNLNPFTGEFMVTVSDINGLFFLFFLNKIYSKTGI